MSNIFKCKQCNENAPMFHTGTDCTTGEWLTLAIINPDGSHLYDNITNHESENLRAFCGSCGMEIDGTIFCDIAYPKDVACSGYSHQIQTLPVNETFIFPKKDRNIISGIVTVKQQKGKGKWRIHIERKSPTGTCTRLT